MLSTASLSALLGLLALFGCAPEPEPAHKKNDPQQVGRLYQQAQNQIKSRDLQAGAATFQQLLQIDSTHYEARLGLGEINLRQQRFDAAVAELEQAYRQQPGRIEARFQLARTYLKLGRKRKARHLFEAIVGDFPDHLPTRILLADLLMTRSPPDPQGALAQYEAILQFKPNHLQARAGAAASRLRLGHFEQAAAELAQLLTERPGDPHLNFLLGTAYHWMEDYPQATAAYKQAIDALSATAADQRLVRQWNLRLAYLATHGAYPGNLAKDYQLQLKSLDATAPVRFTDVAADAGVAKVDRGRGSAWGDYDGDGDLDLFSVGIQSPHALYRNEAGHNFTDITQSAGLYDERGGWSATCADYDNDGDLDLYVTRDAWEGRAPNSLYQNQGDLTFLDQGVAAGVADPDASFTAAWADYDNDGFVDLYVADGITGDGAGNKLYHNQSNGAFVDRAARAGVDHTGKSLGVAFGDYDRDGDLDLYVVDVDGPNTLYRNQGNGHFVDATREAGVAAPEQGGYVAFFLDYDNDGDLDLFVSAMSYYELFVQSQISGRTAGPARAHLYRNNGGGRFADVAVEAGLSRTFGSMGAGFGDVDYDGRIDIYLANGGPMMARFEPNILYHNRGDRFADITKAAGVGNLGKGHGATFADYDNDGDLDLYAGIGGHYPGDVWPNSLYRNEGHANHWLVVELQGRPPNQSAIGAHLKLQAGDLTQMAEVSSGGGFGSSNSLPVEFGLGDRTRIDALEIRWPSGKNDVHRNLGVDQVLRFAEGN